MSPEAAASIDGRRWYSVKNTKAVAKVGGGR
jgi:hypothetical protein